MHICKSLAKYTAIQINAFSIHILVDEECDLLCLLETPLFHMFQRKISHCIEMELCFIFPYLEDLERVALALKGLSDLSDCNYPLDYSFIANRT